MMEHAAGAWAMAKAEGEEEGRPEMTETRSRGRHHRAQTVIFFSSCLVACTAILANPGAAQERLDIGGRVIELGAISGDRSVEFANIRSVVIVDDTALLVASRGSSDVRLFNLAGELVRRWGGVGSGPGEYRGLNAAFVSADSVFVADYRLQRLDTWTLDGVLVDSESLRRIFQNRVVVLGRFRDGRFLARTTPRGPHDEGLVEASADLYSFRLNDDDPTQLGSFPFGYSWGVLRSDGNARRAYTAYPAPLRPEASIAVGSDQWWYAVGEQPRVARFSPEGKRLSTVAVGAVGSEITPAVISAFESEWVSRYRESARPRLRRFLSEVTYPDRLAAIYALRAGPDGTLWVAGEADGDMRMWRIYSEDGSYLGSTALPQRFTLTDISNRWVAGVETREMDVEYVVLFRNPFKQGHARN